MLLGDRRRGIVDGFAKVLALSSPRWAITYTFNMVPLCVAVQALLPAMQHMPIPAGYTREEQRQVLWLGNIWVAGRKEPAETRQSQLSPAFVIIPAHVFLRYRSKKMGRIDRVLTADARHSREARNRAVPPGGERRNAVGRLSRVICIL